jgi:hypothetical protein
MTTLDDGRRVARVDDYIAGNRDADPDVEHIASIAFFSPWYFHRI